MDFTALTDRLLDLLVDAESRLVRPVSRAYLAPGQEVAWDDCCEGGGQLWVKVTGVEEVTAARPGPACGPVMYHVSLELGTLRCTPTQDSQGIAPSPGQLTDNALALLDDTAALLAAIEAVGGRAPVWAPLGPQGGCAGGQWNFYLLVPACAA